MLITLFILSCLVIAYICFTPDMFIAYMKSYHFLGYEDYDEIMDMLFKTMPRAKVIYA